MVGMRWQEQEPKAAPTADALLPLQGLVRSVQTPGFAGVTFHEVLAKSVLNKVPKTSSMPFGWTVNPYRGCSHACVYCFALKTLVTKEVYQVFSGSRASAHLYLIL